MGQFINLAGQRFGRLTVIERVPNDSRTRWVCQCDCGAMKHIQSEYIRSGHTRSCGCLKATANVRVRMKHGQAGRPIYRVWLSMIRRCTNSRVRSWPYYGGRGITVCERWRTFENFYADMGQRPSPKHSIDRIDNDGHYEPGNCRWALPREQAINRRTTIWITHDGETLTLADWSDRTGILAVTLKARHNKGDEPPYLFRPLEKTARGKPEGLACIR